MASKISASVSCCHAGAGQAATYPGPGLGFSKSVNICAVQHIATWSGLTSEAFTVAELLALARQAAGSAEHHLTGLQTPVSLIMDDLIRQALDGGGPLMQAKDAGLITFGSAPLHGGALLEAMTPELVNSVRPGLSAAAAALLAAGSCPALDVVLTSASTREHWDDAAKALAAPLTAQELGRVTNELACE